MAAPLINGVNYAWATVAIRALGGVFTGVTKISYTDKQEIINTYGAGSNPYGRGIGRVEYEGSISLYKEELVALRAIAPAGRLQNIGEFSITVTYDLAGTKRVSDVLKFCRFVENKVDMSEGDTSVVSDIPLAIGDIQFGNLAS